MKHLNIFLAGLSLCLLGTTARADEPMALDGLWKVPNDGGRVQVTPTGKNTYRLVFRLSKEVSARLNASFDGRTLTTFRGIAPSSSRSTTLPASNSRGAAGVLNGESGAGTTNNPTPAPAPTAAPTTGRYRLVRRTVTRDGKQRRFYVFQAQGTADPKGMHPVRSFSRLAYRIRIVTTEGLPVPARLRRGQVVNLKVMVSPPGLRGKVHWSAADAKTKDGDRIVITTTGNRAKVEARWMGQARVRCCFVPAGNTSNTFEAEHPLSIGRAFDSIEIVGMTYRSDHGLLTDHDSSWGSGGKRFPEPEWTPARQHPISHTIGKTLKVRLHLKLEPADAPRVKLRFRAGGSFGAKRLHFDKTVRVGGGRWRVDLEAKGSFSPSSYIEEARLPLRWSYSEGYYNWVEPKNLNSMNRYHNGHLGRTENTVYLTLGKPSAPSRRPGITLKRMRQAIQATRGAMSTDPNKIAKHVISKWSRFNLDVVYYNAWELADDKKDPVTGKLVGADCQTIVRYTQNVLGMAGVPGKAEFVVVWAKRKQPKQAKVNPPEKGHMGNPVQWHSGPWPWSKKKNWAAYLIDGDGRPNNYEAALRFTYKKKTVFYPGGVNAVMTNPRDVLFVFTTMSWVDMKTFKVKKTITKYR